MPGVGTTPPPRAWQPRTHSRLPTSLRVGVPVDGAPVRGTLESRGDTRDLPAHCLSWVKLVIPSTLPEMHLICFMDFRFTLAVTLRTVSEAAEMVEAVLPHCPGVRRQDRMQLDLSSYNAAAFREPDSHTCVMCSLPGVNLSPLLQIRD